MKVVQGGTVSRLLKDVQIPEMFHARQTFPREAINPQDIPAIVEAQIAQMNRVLDMLKFKCWYYDQAIQDGNEERIKAMLPDGLPEEIRQTYQNAHQE